MYVAPTQVQPPQPVRWDSFARIWKKNNFHSTALNEDDHSMSRYSTCGTRSNWPKASYLVEKIGQPKKSGHFRVLHPMNYRGWVTFGYMSNVGYCSPSNFSQISDLVWKSWCHLGFPCYIYFWLFWPSEGVLNWGISGIPKVPMLSMLRWSKSLGWLGGTPMT